MDRLTSMSVFVKAVELGSFSATANAFNMSPQLVGKHVRMLEERLNVRLLNRTTRHQSLTEVGRAFYERAKNILAEVEESEAIAAQINAIPRGRIKISAPTTFGTHALAPQLPEFLSTYPEISIDLSLTNRIVDLIDEGFDLVFRVGELPDSGLIARKLKPYQLILCAAPLYLKSSPPINSPKDLKYHECLGFSHTTLQTHWQFEGAEGHFSVPVSGRFMTDSGDALLPAAIAGLGIMLQSAEMVTPAIEKGLLVHLLPDYHVPTRPMHILYASNRHVLPKLRCFIDFCIKKFGECEQS